MTFRGLSAAATVLTALLTVCSSTPAVGADPTWVWPLQPRPVVVAVFAPPDLTWHPGHRGVDLLGAAGQPVLAIGAGRVTFAGPVAGRGVVVVDHGGLRSTYEPVLARVAGGEHVEAGEALGVLQAVRSHCLPRVCLHLGLKRGDCYLDPLELLTGRDVRLKPVRGSSSVLSPSGPTVGAGGSNPHRDSTGGPLLTARSVVGGVAAATAAWLATSRRRRPQARG